MECYSSDLGLFDSFLWTIHRSPLKWEKGASLGEAEKVEIFSHTLGYEMLKTATVQRIEAATNDYV